MLLNLHARWLNGATGSATTHQRILYWKIDMSLPNHDMLEWLFFKQMGPSSLSALETVPVDAAALWGWGSFIQRVFYSWGWHEFPVDTLYVLALSKSLNSQFFCTFSKLDILETSQNVTWWRSTDWNCKMKWTQVTGHCAGFIHILAPCMAF